MLYLSWFCRSHFYNDVIFRVIFLLYFLRVNVWWESHTHMCANYTYEISKKLLDRKRNANNRMVITVKGGGIMPIGRFGSWTYYLFESFYFQSCQNEMPSATDFFFFTGVRKVSSNFSFTPVHSSLEICLEVPSFCCHLCKTIFLPISSAVIIIKYGVGWYVFCSKNFILYKFNTRSNVLILVNSSAGKLLFY